MSADLLRKAATILRERAEAATPGPWGIADHWGLDDERAYVISEADVPNYVSAGGGIEDDHDAPYIATMHPGVGLALADWLDVMASVWDGGGKHVFGRLPGDPETDSINPTSLMGRAIAVARLIVGEFA